MARYKKKLVVVDAIRLKDGNFDEILNFMSLGESAWLDQYQIVYFDEECKADIIEIGDWAIKYQDGKIESLKPEAFEKIYEEE